MTLADHEYEAAGPRVVQAFGSAASDWILPSYAPLTRDFRVALLSANEHKGAAFVKHVRSRRSLLASQPGGRHAAWALDCALPTWDRILGLERHLAGADLVHTLELTSGNSLAVAEAHARGGFRHVVTVWENIADRLGERTAVRRAKQRVLASADQFIAVTERARTALMLEGADPERITVVGPGQIDGVDHAPRTPLPNRTRLLFVGRKERSKGVAELLQAWALLRRDPELSERDIELRFVGIEPSRGANAELVRRLGLAGSFHEEGNLDHAAVQERYATADVLVAPSRVTSLWQEQWGMVLMEAMARGLAVVTTASGSTSEVAGDAALYVRPNDHHTLYTALKRLVLEPELALDLGRTGLERARELFGAERAAERIAGVYRRALGAETASARREAA